ncbi:protein TPRXL [Pyrus ussuriensis x Pyrus communis]|uniref:Protein TPRXL n=1 Tax=Pyrus ussuriensis x Pyrus communis TaxID=2448454 RepID=A0A5N5FVJ5_9ROSA|nr:protein TPRXL [Pyrus ussuriensis x Pyrus communis]
MANSSSALEGHYHGEASAFVSVPFTWESQPGTPKSKFLQNPSRLAPLTPPPSYFSDSPKRSSRKKNSKSSPLVPNILPKIRSTSTTSRKASTPSSMPAISSASPSSFSSSASSSSSPAYSTTYHSVPSSPVTPTKVLARGRSMSSPKVFVDSRILRHDQYEDYHGSKFSARGCHAPFIKLFLRKFH